jgi:hypothetical protein
MANVTVQAPTGVGKGSYGLWIEQGPSTTIVQASNVRLTSSGANAILIEAENTSFYGENLLIENWGAGQEGFLISSNSSVAYLGVGCSHIPASGVRPYSPVSRFWTAGKQNPPP